MPCLFMKTFAPFHMVNDKLRAFLLSDNLTDNFGSVHKRFSNFHFIIVGEHKNFIKNHFVAFVTVKFFCQI